jgi:hypothetical protein
MTTFVTCTVCGNRYVSSHRIAAVLLSDLYLKVEVLLDFEVDIVFVQPVGKFDSVCPFKASSGSGQPGAIGHPLALGTQAERFATN